MEELKSKGMLKLDSISDEVVLLEEDLLISVTQTKGYVTEESSGVTVVLDTNLTEELVEEGYVRELISKIQTMRKEAGFEVMDKIAVSCRSDQKIADIFEKNRNTIQSEVLAVKVTDEKLGGYEKEWNINGEHVVMEVKKEELS